MDSEAGIVSSGVHSLRERTGVGRDLEIFRTWGHYYSKKQLSGIFFPFITYCTNDMEIHKHDTD